MIGIWNMVQEKTTYVAENPGFVETTGEVEAARIFDPPSGVQEPIGAVILFATEPVQPVLL